MRNIVLFLAFLSCYSLGASAQEAALKPPVTAGAEKVRIAETGDHVISNIHHPSITYYPAVKGKVTGAAIIIAPGGGHVEEWIGPGSYAL